MPSALATYGGVTAGRVEPDVAMDADSTTGFLMGQTVQFADGTTKYSESRIGGTSLSSPLFTGLLALAIGANGGTGLGQINPTLYAASKTIAGEHALFRDPSAVRIVATTGQSALAAVRPDHTVTDDPSSPMTYSLRTLGNLATLHRRNGYDDSTGLGSPKAAPLIHLLVPSWKG